jgi:hypothetical protein
MVVVLPPPLPALPPLPVAGFALSSPPHAIAAAVDKTANVRSFPLMDHLLAR